MDRDWRPTAGPEMLKARAAMLREIRAFFDERDVLEVETPLLSRHANPDPALQNLRTRYQGPGGARDGLELFLHTSPEFPMKRLLAAGSGPIYQICKAFRDGERGRRHNPEFTLLEWYRPGFDHHRLMDELEALLQRLLPGCGRCDRVDYAGVFQRRLGIDPHVAGSAELRALALREGIAGAQQMVLPDRDAWLDLLLSHCIEPELARAGPVLVYDYPASQAALARIRPGSPPLAERFELYLKGMELANGFHELTDPGEQRRRFEAENAERAASDRPAAPLDRWLLKALEAGPLPPCAGVALGLDRVLMLRTGAACIDEVLAFALEGA